MNKTSIVLKSRRLLLCALLAGTACAGAARAEPHAGEAIVVARVGTTQARCFVGPIHEGRTTLKDVVEGDSLGETSRLITGKDGHECVMLTPGATICIAPNSEVALTKLRHTADGLPASEADIVRRIQLDLVHGRILIHGGAPTASLDLDVNVPNGRVESHGGTFVVAQGDDGRWDVFSEEYAIDVVPKGGPRTTVEQGKAVQIATGAEGTAAAQADDTFLTSPRRSFELCREYLQDLSQFLDPIAGVDRQGLGNYLGGTKQILGIGDAGWVADVSPSLRPVGAAAARQNLTKPAGPGTGGRWTEQQIWDWWNSVGVVRGVNYIPRTAVNSTEMWQQETFDPDTIDQELGWAHDAGYTALRVQLQYVAWQEDPRGFLDRMDRFLDLAKKHSLRVVPVIFDDLNLAGRAPSAGPQPGPVPGVYNAQWTPSPGAAAVVDRQRWPDLEKYLRAVIGKFKTDDRVLYWDLYNTAGNDNLWEKSLPLMDQTFNWARDMRPKQPLAVAAWREFGSAMAARQFERSDLITFESFESAENVEARILLLRRYNRPLICSDWLMRQQENDFEKILPVFAASRVGWFNCGLVQGKTQTWIQQADRRTGKASDLWQQNVLRPDGKAYDNYELELIRGFRYAQGP